jgi:hypothetical protein
MKLKFRRAWEECPRGDWLLSIADAGFGIGRSAPNQNPATNHQLE